MNHFTLDVDTLERDLWVFGCGVELHQGKGAGVAVTPDQARSLCHLVRVAISETGTF